MLLLQSADSGHERFAAYVPVMCYGFSGRPGASPFLIKGRERGEHQPPRPGPWCPGAGAHARHRGPQKGPPAKLCHTCSMVTIPERTESVLTPPGTRTLTFAGVVNMAQLHK